MARHRKRRGTPFPSANPAVRSAIVRHRMGSLSVTGHRKPRTGTKKAKTPTFRSLEARTLMNLPPLRGAKLDRRTRDYRDYRGGGYGSF